MKRKRISWATLTIAALLLCLVKHHLVTALPLEARDYRTDDLMMLKMAESLLAGNWLGNYDPVILMKGAFFPMFLAAASRSGLSYLSALNLMNSLACVFFVSQMRYLFRDKRLLFILFAVLLFDPCSFSRLTFQRVYRPAVTGMQVLVLFGSYFGLYLRARMRRSRGTWKGLWHEALLGVAGGFSLWAMWNTREETMWIVPFVLVGTLLIVTEYLSSLRSGKGQRFRIAAGLVGCLLPVVMLGIGNRWIRQENAVHYGAPVRLEEIDGAFGEALKTIYSVKNKDEIPYVTVSREKLDRLYEASESLRLIRTELDRNMDYYCAADRNQLDREVEDGWFFWGLKRAAFENGAADTLPHSQAFWTQVRAELESALDSSDSVLEQQAVMPSALISPWQPAYLVQLPSAVWEAIRYTVAFQEFDLLTEASTKASDPVSRRFAEFTGNPVVYVNQVDEAQHLFFVSLGEKLNRIILLFRALNPVICFLAFSALLFLPARRFQAAEKNLFPFFMVLSGMLLSAGVMLSGVAYTHISAFPAIDYHYLAGVYPLMLAGEWLVLLYVAEGLPLIRHKTRLQKP